MGVVDVLLKERTLEIILSLAVVGFGYATEKYHGKFKEIKGLIDTLDKALEDNKLTKDEIKEIISEVKDVAEA